MPRILIVDDDAGIRDVISEFLSSHEFEVATAEDGIAMDDQLENNGPFDLIVLDQMLPGEHGLSIARRIAGPGQPGIIILSAIGDESDRIVGLEIGADDYLTKPCNPRELLARIRAVLRRRTEPAEQSKKMAAHFAGWKLDLVARELVSPKGVLIALSDSEFTLLRAFITHPQEALSREQLTELSRGRDTARDGDGAERVIDVQVSRLRRKLESGDAEAELIRTIRNEGYMFMPDVERS